MYTVKKDVWRLQITNDHPIKNPIDYYNLRKII